jgi:hypothetical protein
MRRSTMGRKGTVTKRLCVSLVAFAVVGFVAAGAPASTAKSLAIEHGVGIGPVTLGMSGPEVWKQLGSPRSVIERRVVGGQPYVEFEYDFGAWNVGFLGRRGQRRVVLVGTGLSRQRSPEGVGVGTSEQTFWRRVTGKGFFSRRCDRPDPSGSIYNASQWVRRKRDSETVYFPGGPPSSRRVTAVEVRSRPTFGCGF